MTAESRRAGSIGTGNAGIVSAPALTPVADRSAAPVPAPRRHRVVLVVGNDAALALRLEACFGAAGYQCVATGWGEAAHFLETRQPHLLKAYDAAFLVGAIQEKKLIHRKRGSASDASSARYFDWAQTLGGELGA